MSEAERLTTQMARHRGHHKYLLLRIPLRRASTGEQPHSGHGTATSSRLLVTVFLLCRKCDLPGWEEHNQAGGVAHTVRSAWSGTRPGAIGARPLPRGYDGARAMPASRCADARIGRKRPDQRS